jgi:hypothetical protein
MITLINGNPQNLAGLIVPNGHVDFQLNVDATVVAAPYGFVSGQVVVTFQFNAVGQIQPNSPAAAAQIYSNTELNPQNSIGLGTYYLVTFYDQNDARINHNPMWWQFTQAAGATVDIGEMIPFSTVGGNVIFYPTSFTIPPPGPLTLGGIFSNAGSPNEWVSSINTNGSVNLSQPSFANISGTLSNAQLPSPIVFTSITASGLITAQDNLQLGVAGSQTGIITFEGGTSGSATITGPAVAATATNPFLFSNGINIPAGTAYSINTDTGISRTSAAVLAVGDGTAGDASGTVNAAQYNVAGSQIAASNLSNGVTGTGTIVLSASPTLTGTLTAAAITASGLVIAQANLHLGVAGTTGGVLTLEGATSGACTITAPAVAGTPTNPIVFSNTVEVPALQLGAVGTGPAITFGAGVPSGSAVNGSLYVNTSGSHTAVTLLYIYDLATTAWVAIA